MFKPGTIAVTSISLFRSRSAPFSRSTLVLSFRTTTIIAPVLLWTIFTTSPLRDLIWPETLAFLPAWIWLSAYITLASSMTQVITNNSRRFTGRTLHLQYLFVARTVALWAQPYRFRPAGSLLNGFCLTTNRARRDYRIRLERGTINSAGM